jgi:hypothetical protein
VVVIQSEIQLTVYQNISLNLCVCDYQKVGNPWIRLLGIHHVFLNFFFGMPHSTTNIFVILLYVIAMIAYIHPEYCAGFEPMIS